MKVLPNEFIFNKVGLFELSCLKNSSFCNFDTLYIQRDVGIAYIYHFTYRSRKSPFKEICRLSLQTSFFCLSFLLVILKRTKRKDHLAEQQTILVYSVHVTKVTHKYGGGTQKKTITVRLGLP